jgi:SAM-dependent methyltransferase
MTGRSDEKTARAFATSWNNLPSGSVYTTGQFEDWLLPLGQKDVTGKRVLELGCGNASLLTHMASWKPAYCEGVDLGESVVSARKNMERSGAKNWAIVKSDLTAYQSAGFDVVYCIGVLHHLKDPKKGFDSVVRNVAPGGRFHCWVYAREGNGVVIYFVDPLRKLVSRLPWWFTKYAVATPLAVPFFLYAKLMSFLKTVSVFRKFPLFEYSLWIAQREFGFFRHVAFDQLVTPQTAYLRKTTIEQWLASTPGVDPSTAYVTMRNGNSWKFGARTRSA